MFDSMPMPMGVLLVIIAVSAVLLLGGVLLIARVLGARERDRD